MARIASAHASLPSRPSKQRNSLLCCLALACLRGREGGRRTALSVLSPHSLDALDSSSLRGLYIRFSDVM